VKIVTCTNKNQEKMIAVTGARCRVPGAGCQKYVYKKDPGKEDSSAGCRVLGAKKIDICTKKKQEKRIAVPGAGGRVLGAKNRYMYKKEPGKEDYGS
jgi:hypothetical protein